MGADLLLVAVKVGTTEELKAQVSSLTPFEFEELFAYEVESYEDGLDGIREALELAIGMVVNDDRRDTARMFLGGSYWCFTGGMSWGDDPTDAWGPLQLLAMVQRFVDMRADQRT